MDVYVICTHRVHISSDVDGFFFMNFLRNSLSRKYIALLCNYYRFWHKSDLKGVNVSFWLFNILSNFNSFFLQHDLQNGLLFGPVSLIVLVITQQKGVNKTPNQKFELSYFSSNFKVFSTNGHIFRLLMDH